MAKKKGGKSKGFISQGERPNVSKKVRNELRRDYMQSGDRVVNQLKAHRAGKRVMVTIENPNKKETNKRLIRVPASTLWRDAKTISGFSM
jgi:hypothetical protein